LEVMNMSYRTYKISSVDLILLLRGQPATVSIYTDGSYFESQEIKMSD
jgi:hypothetical protein